MDVERPLYRKPLPSTPSSAPTPNTAFKRKPIPVAVTPATPIATGQDLKDKPCPHCGAGTAQEREKTEHPKNDTFAADAQRRISELEAEVKILTGKATAAADKLADYEDELEKLKAARARSPSPRPSSVTPSAAGGSQPNANMPNEDAEAIGEEGDTVSSLPAPPPPAQPVTRPGGGLGRSLTTTRITNFLAARRNAPAAKATSPTSSGADSGVPTGEADLTARLTEAENARRAAETKLTQTNQELEELSASLFQSANEMVSTERRQNAEREADAEKKAAEREEQWQKWQKQVKANERAAAARSKSLEDKIKKLEQRVKLLEDREKEKAKRLDRLELAMKRAARVRGLLQPQQQAPAQQPYAEIG